MIVLPNIPDELWSARPVLKELRTEAHRRCAGADAVLWSFLVAVAANIPARVSIDTGIGVPVRPTLYAVLAGASGTGKSLAWGVARSLLPGTPEPLPLSTGEGMIESFYGRVQVDQPQPDGKPAKLVWVRRRVRSNALFWLDEGETLFRQLERPGTIVDSVLRSFWSGGTVGQANATEDARRGLDAGTYTGGLVVGLQPDISGRLLADTATGTAQRFVWAASTDVHLTDDPEGLVQFRRPGLTWTPPALPGEPDKMAQFLGGPAAPPPPPVSMLVDANIVRGIRAHQVALRRGDIEPDEQDTQRTSMRVKIAAVLAWLEGRLCISPEDWEVAGGLLDASDQVRGALLEHAETVTVRRRTEQGIERAQISQAVTDAEVTRLACRRRVLEELAQTPTSLPHSELRRRVTPRQRALFPEVMGLLVDGGTVAVDEVGGGRRYSLSLAEGGDGGDGR